MQLSIVIPALDEAAQLPRLLAQLHGQRGVTLDLIVADGGSRDGTPALAAAAGATVVRAARGRAVQMNAGARHARSPHLLFLHADSQLDDPGLLATALAALERASAAADHGPVAGHFPLRFTGYPPQAAAFYRHLEGKTALNRAGTINGDQGLLIRAEDFQRLGGYDESLPFLEDQRIAERIWRQGRWIVLPGQLVTSARRFESEGRAARYTLMAVMMALHAAGVQEFFARAPGVYAAQADSARLDLAPYLHLVRRVLWERRWRRLFATLYRVGRYVRDNAWQLFYWRDQRHRDPALPRLRFYDRRLARLLRNPLADGLATALVCGWFFLWLPLTVKRTE